MNFEPIGIIHSCYKEKFGIPRQPRLVRCASATLELLPPFDNADAFRGIEEFSHVWIIFVFHQSICESFQPTVRPPRLGGNIRTGVFASRSNFRPNPIGFSAVELRGVNGTTLELAGGDFLDGTPVLDIKPYIPYADSIPDARGGFAVDAPEVENSVKFSPAAEAAVKELETPARPALRQLITETLSFNPRPAYQQDDFERVYGTKFFDLDVQWKYENVGVKVVKICSLSL